MRTNQQTILVGDRVLLVPYAPRHVPRYHEWMQSPELQELTASEPLTLIEEYDMQKSWVLDDDKLTFIVLARTPTRGEGENVEENVTSASPQPDPSPLTSLSSVSTVSRSQCSILDDVSPSDPNVLSLPMIGDVNLFLKVAPSYAGDDDPLEAEVEVMIAEPSYRRTGCAREALQLMLAYATAQPHTVFVSSASPLATAAIAPESRDTDEYQPGNKLTNIPLTVTAKDSSPLPIDPTALVARIGATNKPSLRLFQSLGFEMISEANVFGEVELRWRGGGKVQGH